VDTGAPDTSAPDVAPPPIDAGPGCFEGTPYVQELVCPELILEGTPARVSLTVVNGGCCSGGETTTEVTTTPSGEIVIDARMTVCDCCAECDCIGPIETTSVDLPPLAPGRHLVRAGEQECAIEVRPAGACRPLPTTDVRMPRAIFSDQELPISLISRLGDGCGCTPRQMGTVGDPAATLGMELCDCCDACACVDGGYEASVVHRAPPLGTQTVNIDGLMPSYVSVMERSACRGDMRPTAVRVELPTGSVHSGPRLTWLVVTGEETVCCVEPFYVVESRRTGDFFEVDLNYCPPELDCDCVPPGPTSFEAWHALGELAPGGYSAIVGGEALSFTVP